MSKEKERGKNQSEKASPDNILEDYLDKFARFGDQSAIIVNSNGTEPVTSSLDGTRLYFPNRLAEKTGLNEREINELLNSGILKGVMMGDTWLASLEAIREYQDRQAKRK